MRAVVDKDTCIGCGLCIATEPDVFAMDDDGKALSIADTTDENRDSVETCISGCPVDAIHEEGQPYSLKQVFINKPAVWRVYLWWNSSVTFPISKNPLHKVVYIFPINDYYNHDTI